jgi:uncharacterized protein HemY
VKLAGQALAREPNNGNFQNTLGVALYRTHDWVGAIKALERGLELRHGGTATDFFFLAMAHWKRGDKEKARTWFDKGVAWMGQNSLDNLDLEAIRAEAKATLGR